jgi:hypothetical protein
MEVVRRLADEDAPELDILSVPVLLHDTPGAVLLSFAEDCFPSLVRVLVCDHADTAELATALALADVVLQAPWSMFDLAAVVQAALYPQRAAVLPDSLLPRD